MYAVLQLYQELSLDETWQLDVLVLADKLESFREADKHRRLIIDHMSHVNPQNVIIVNYDPAD